MDHRGYYAIIPAHVRYDKDLTPNAKLLYGEITALCNEKGYCWAGDSYFAELYGVGKNTIQRWLKQLENKKYIFRKIIYEEGTRNIKSRYIYLCDNPIPKNKSTPIPKNKIENITSLNNTSNNILNIPYEEIVDYLNKKADKNYRHTTKKTRSLIKARWDEGFRLDDFKKVIDIKTAEWKGTKMDKYLRPETLFGTKFEGYLNQNNRPFTVDPKFENLF